MLSMNVDEKSYTQGNNDQQAAPQVIVMNGSNENCPTQTRIDDVREYFYLSIFHALCCFMPLGIAAVIMSRKTNKKKHINDLEGAQQASRMTAVLNVTGYTFGLLVIILFVIIHL